MAIAGVPKFIEMIAKCRQVPMVSSQEARILSISTSLSSSIAMWKCPRFYTARSDSASAGPHNPVRKCRYDAQPGWRCPRPAPAYLHRHSPSHLLTADGFTQNQRVSTVKDVVCQTVEVRVIERANAVTNHVDWLIGYKNTQRVSERKPLRYCWLISDCKTASPMPDSSPLLRV